MGNKTLGSPVRVDRKERTKEGRMKARTHTRGTSNLKRDIFAVITFVATGFLFYLIQAHGPAQFGSEKVSDAVEQLSVHEALTETPVANGLKEGGSRDS
jgi:hypothetical protein